MVIADETADISSTEQLPIEVRLVEDIDGKAQIREEFLTFIPLEDMGAAIIADSIVIQAQKFGLDLNKMHGQGCDGYKKMAGKDNGFQARIIENMQKQHLFISLSE